jgi:hypothetical protein
MRSMVRMVASPIGERNPACRRWSARGKTLSRETVLKSEQVTPYDVVTGDGWESGTVASCAAPL